MIAVIADDITGAAELGGIGIRHGLATEIRTTVGPATNADLLVIAADSRSKDQTAAVEEMTVITRELRLLKPEFIYKKTDSVLRGHVIAELKTHLQALDCHLALLVPANPSLGRTIRDGQYYLNDKPIHESSFSIDPEFPILSSNIQEMLHTKANPVHIRKPGEDLPVRGIVVGEAASPDDLATWARHIPPKTLLAGAAGFFSAILDTQYKTVTIPTPILNKPVLYVNGSTFKPNHDRIREQVATYIAIESNPLNLSALELRTQMAKEVAAIFRKTAPAELIIAGGSTAYAILRQMGWHNFIPEQELAQGVVRMSVPESPGLHLTVKPGSYAWPPSISY